MDETELLACHDLSPYGSRTIESVVARDLLPVTNTAKDYTLFEIPDDLLTLDRVTLGNGFRNISQLIPVYKEAGSLIGRYSREYKMRHLGIKSLAILRNSGQLVFAPAYHFEPGNVDPKLPIGDFSKSVKELLHHVLYGRKIVSLVNSLEVGYHDARNES
ncbi:MAG: hypothetical protein ACREF7_04535 [Candidatus Saccharimonadales bacterium]